MLPAISFSGGSRRLLLALIGAAIVGAGALLGYLLWSGHREALADAERTTRNFAWLLEASFDSALRRLDANLADIADDLPAEALERAALPRFAPRMDRELDHQMRHFAELTALRVFDRAGDMLYTSGSATTRRTNIADRPYFQKLRDDPHAGLVFSEVLTARATGQPAIIAARAVYRDGRFAGAVIALLDLEHFQHLLDSVDIGAQGAIAIRRSDTFTLAMRRPVYLGDINQAPPPQNESVRAVKEGKRMATLRFTAPVDGIERIFSLRTLERYPYFVIVGLATEEVLAGWRARALATGLLGTLLLGLLAYVLVRLVAAEAQAARIVGDLALSSQQLVESEARLDDALEIARMAEWEYELDARRFLLNDRFFRVLRTEAACAGGKLLTADEFAAQLLDPEDAAAFVAMLERATAEFDSGKTWEEQLRLRCGSSASRWMLLRFQRVPPSRDGGRRLLAGTLLDVHERQEAEQARRRLTGLQTAILEAAGYSVISTTPAGVITSFNRAAERMLGYGAGEMIGRQTPAIIHDAAEVVARAQEFSAELGVAIEPGFEVFVARTRRQLPNTYEWTYVRKDGSRFPVLLSVTALRDEDGVIAGFLGIAADVSVHKRTLEALRESEAALNAAQAVAHVGSWTLDIAANRLLWSDETYRIFGIAPGTPLTYDVFIGQVHPADRPAVDAAWQAAMGGAPYDIEHRLLVDGAVRWVRERAEMVFAAGAPVSGVGTVQDITERKQAEQRLQLLAGVFQHSGEALMITDHANSIVEVNPAFTRQTGYGADEVRGRNPRMLSAGRTPGETYKAMWSGIRDNGFWQGEIWDRRKDGGIFPKLLTITVVTDSTGAVTHHIASFTDITEQKATEEQIRHLALHDALTGLPNRLDLKGRLEQALAAARRDRQQVAVMFLDLDRFKQINDSLGHKVGDLLLVEVARRLSASVRDSDIVARLGGDEFVVVLPNVLNQALAARMADKILRALDQPYLLEGRQVESSPSIGIALFPADGDDDETLLKRADEAMYRAKALGRNNWQFFAA